MAESRPEKSTKLFTLAFKADYMRRQGNIYNRPLPEILTSLVLDWGIDLTPENMLSIRKLNVESSMHVEIDVFGLTFSITRTK